MDDDPSGNGTMLGSGYEVAVKVRGREIASRNT
jgi:hypothetical protein